MTRPLLPEALNASPRFDRSYFESSRESIRNSARAIGVPKANEVRGIARFLGPALGQRQDLLKCP
jgi:hypothetical protein